MHPKKTNLEKNWQKQGGTGSDWLQLGFARVQAVPVSVWTVYVWKVFSLWCSALEGKCFQLLEKNGSGGQFRFPLGLPAESREVQNVAHSSLILPFLSVFSCLLDF